MKDTLPFNLLNRLSSNSQSDQDFHNKVLFDEKIWIILDDEGRITFTNNRCKIELGLYEGTDIPKLNTEPDLKTLIENLNKSNYNNFNFELFIGAGDESRTYNAALETIVINKRKYYTLVLNTLENSNKLEAKISDLHHALEYGQVPVLIIDDNGKIIFATKSFEKLLELDLDVIYSNHLSSVLSWYLTNKELAEVQGAIVKGRKWSASIYLNGESDDTQVLDLELNPIANDDGSKRGFILTGHDVSAYYQKNRLIKKSEEKLRSIINSISDPLLIFKIKNDEYKYEDANFVFRQLFELGNSELFHDNLKKLIPGKFYEKLITSTNLMLKNKLNSIEFDCLGPKDRNFAAKLTFQYDSNANEDLYILSLRDITERIANEKQIKEAYKKEIQMNQLKTTFLQNMSHELRTPATAVMGYSEIMQDCLDNGDYEAIEEITKSLEGVVKRLINLFTKILEVTEIESDEVELQKVKLNCNKIVKAVYEQKLKDAKSKNIELLLSLGNMNDLIEIDWLKFEKALHYLIDNGIKYTDRGSVTISTLKEHKTVVVRVTDTGRGMNQKIIDRLLEPFVQEDEDGLTREYEGAGLGLTIAHKYVKLMGGKMEVESERKKGTQINLIFPAMNAMNKF